MENQSRPSIKGSKKAPGNLERRLTLLQNEIQNIKGESNLPIEISSEIKSDHKFTLKCGTNTQDFFRSSGSSPISWLECVKNNYVEFSNRNIARLESSRKNYSSFRKKLSSHLKSPLKNQDSSLKPLLAEHFKDHQYRELYNIIHNIQSLPTFLLSLEAIKGYTICQLVSHEKGQAYAMSNLATLGGKSTNKRISIAHFNKSFQTIKKSKSKVFQSQNFPTEIIEVIGTFQSKTFVGSKYNLILILGRNDFLPPDTKEKDIFEQVTEQLDPVLNAILFRSSHDDKILNIIDSLEQAPVPVSISDRSDKFLFKNESFEKMKEQDFRDYRKVEKELTGKNLLRTYYPQSNLEGTDLYHFYRVSLLGELLNTLRHELSNPLFGLSLASDILDTDNKDEDIIETVFDIKTNSKRCQTIIKNFSDLYQGEENFKEFNLVELLRETVILTKSETKGIQKKILSEGQEIFIFSNPTWLSQIVFNLIINSGQAILENSQSSTRNSFINIQIKPLKDKVFIEISDNGPGVPKGNEEKLFKSFFTTKDSGTGLGLSICKNLIRKLDGDIMHGHRDGGGALFTIILPHES